MPARWGPRGEVKRFRNEKKRSPLKRFNGDEVFHTSPPSLSNAAAAVPLPIPPPPPPPPTTPSRVHLKRFRNNRRLLFYPLPLFFRILPLVRLAGRWVWQLFFYFLIVSIWRLMRFFLDVVTFGDVLQYLFSYPDCFSCFVVELMYIGLFYDWHARFDLDFFLVGLLGFSNFGDCSEMLLRFLSQSYVLGLLFILFAECVTQQGLMIVFV